MDISKIDQSVIDSLNKIKTPFARISIFIVYFWFGTLKLFGLSPASPLVENLLTQTLPFIRFNDFILLLGVFEILIGVGFLFPKLTRVMTIALFAHMITTALPLILLPQITWSGFLVPTLEGQYILKNVLIIALAVVIGSSLPPLNKR
ncbi:MAG: hypothetical protein AAB521_04415 [Patescibacteria group bacterium]